VPESETFCVLDSQTLELCFVMLLREMDLTNLLHYEAYSVGMWCHVGGRSLPNVEWNSLLPSPGKRLPLKCQPISTKLHGITQHKTANIKSHNLKSDVPCQNVTAQIIGQTY
jgi:hypothetical protein